MKPVPATSPLGGVVSSNMAPKGPATSITPKPPTPSNPAYKASEQGVGGQRKGYGERTGVEAVSAKGGQIPPLPKPATSNPSKDHMPRSYTQRPAT